MENICNEIKDLPELIRRNDYYNYISYIESFEDTLQKVLNSKNNSNFKNDDKIFLCPINEYINKDLFKNMICFDYNNFGVKFCDENNISGIVITGPYIRNCLININFDEENKDKKTKISIRKSIYIYKYKEQKWTEIIENIGEYTESDNEYILELEDRTICLVKKKYYSTSQILLQHDYTKRIGWEDGTFYVSSRFLIEYQKHKKTIMSKVCDPILHIPYDPLGIYYMTENNNKNILKVIDSIDIEELMKLSTKNIIKLYNSKTLVEICIDKYIKETNMILIEQLEKMIVYLLQFEFKRPPSLYANIININKKNEILYQFICENEKKDKDNHKGLQNFINKNENIKNIDDINNLIIEYYIKEDNTHCLIDFLGYIQQKLVKKILEKIVKYNAKNIIKELIENKIVDDYMTYYLILMSGNVELIEIINFDMDVAINFLKDIITNGIFESFDYMIENDKTIITYIFEDNKNIFHMIKMKGNYKKIIKKMFECYPELVNICDKNGETPLLYHSKNNPKIIDSFLEYDDYIDLTIRDNEGNNCLHYLCKYDEKKILKNILKKYPELINMPNSKSEYPIMICCKNKLEGMFYILKNNGANLNVRDLYGNTVFHYICSNSISLGIEIKNIPNFFGVTPKDYCVLSSKYYHFVEVE